MNHLPDVQGESLEQSSKTNVYGELTLSVKNFQSLLEESEDGNKWIKWHKEPLDKLRKMCCLGSNMITAWNVFRNADTFIYLSLNGLGFPGLHVSCCEAKHEIADIHSGSNSLKDFDSFYHIKS